LTDSPIFTYPPFICLYTPQDGVGPCSHYPFEPPPLTRDWPHHVNPSPDLFVCLLMFPPSHSSSDHPPDSPPSHELSFFPGSPSPLSYAPPLIFPLSLTSFRADHRPRSGRAFPGPYLYIYTPFLPILKFFFVHYTLLPQKLFRC